ncbi:MAG: hypothetical protein ACR2QA_04310 [Solirubrobacteraceae bacterium]
MAVLGAGAQSADARSPAPGTLDPSFGAHGLTNLSSGTRFLALTVDPSGRTVAAGLREQQDQFGQSTGATLVVARVTRGGRSDSSFGGGVVSGPPILSNGVTGSTGSAVAIQRDGKIVVAGTATDPTAIANFGMIVERFNPNGTLDRGFGSGGVARIFQAENGQAFAVAIQSDGKIVVGGSASALDAGSSTGSPYPRVALARLAPNGSPDPGFGSGGTDILPSLGRDAAANAIGLERDGRIAVAGSQRQNLQTSSALIARLTPNGSLDGGFAFGGADAHQYAVGGGYSSFQALDVAPDGRVVAAGSVANGNSTDGLVVRFTAAGKPDSSFGHAGVVEFPAASNFAFGAGQVPGPTGVRIAADGTILLAGTFVSSSLGNLDLRALTPSGASDRRFGGGGEVKTQGSTGISLQANALAIAPDGGLVIAGDSATPTGQDTGLVARYIGLTPSLDPRHPSLSAHSPGGRISFNRGGHATLTIVNGNAIPVSVSVKLVSASRVRVDRHHLRKVQLASGRNAVRANGQARISLRLRGGDRALLRRLRGVTAIVTLTARDSHGNTVTVHQRFRVSSR